jgi:hypothetical protein
MGQFTKRKYRKKQTNNKKTHKKHSRRNLRKTQKVGGEINSEFKLTPSVFYEFLKKKNPSWSRNDIIAKLKSLKISVYDISYKTKKKYKNIINNVESNLLKVISGLKGDKNDNSIKYGLSINNYKNIGNHPEQILNRTSSNMAVNGQELNIR